LGTTRLCPQEINEDLFIGCRRVAEKGFLFDFLVRIHRKFCLVGHPLSESIRAIATVKSPKSCLKITFFLKKSCSFFVFTYICSPKSCDFKERVTNFNVNK
jgi:hypothetical protein